MIQRYDFSTQYSRHAMRLSLSADAGVFSSARCLACGVAQLISGQRAARTRRRNPRRWLTLDCRWCCQLAAPSRGHSPTSACSHYSSLTSPMWWWWKEFRTGPVRNTHLFCVFLFPIWARHSSLMVSASCVCLIQLHFVRKIRITYKSSLPIHLAVAAWDIIGVRQDSVHHWTTGQGNDVVSVFNRARTHLYVNTSLIKTSFILRIQLNVKYFLNWLI